MTRLFLRFTLLTCRCAAEVSFYVASASSQHPQRERIRPMSDEIDYKLIGDDLQAVIITLDPGEMVIAEAGAMMYMQDGIVMNTTLDPNAQGGGLMGKLFQGAKRALSGDTFFVTTFANAANRRQDVAFSSHFPGKIRPVDLREWGGTIIAQKDSFLVRGARRQRHDRVHEAHRRRLLRRRRIHSPAHRGRRPRISSRVGHAARDSISGRRVAARRHRLPRRDGASRSTTTSRWCRASRPRCSAAKDLFFARLRGPGRVMLQTMPFSRLADRILAAAPRARRRRVATKRSVASARGIIGGVIGSMIDGTAETLRALASRIADGRHRNARAAKGLSGAAGAEAARRKRAPPSMGGASASAGVQARAGVPRGEIVALKGSTSRCATASSSGCSARTAPERRRRSEFSPRA